MVSLIFVTTTILTTTVKGTEIAHMSEPATSPDPSVTPAAELDQAVQTSPAADAGSVGEQFPANDSGANLSYEELMEAWNAKEESGANDQPSPESTPASAPVVPTEAPPAAAAVPPVEPSDAKNFRVSIKGRDDVTAKAIALVAHNPDMSIEEAIARVKPATPTPEATPPAPAPSASQTLADIRARQDALKEELQAAYAEMDFEKAGALQAEGLELAEQKLFAAQRQAEADAQAKNAEEEAWDRFNAQASAMYPEATQEGSAFHSQMQSIYHAMEDAGDPLINSPESTLRIAQMAAARLGVAPVTAKVVPVPTPSPAAPAPKTVATPRLVPMDGGSSGGVPATAAQAAAAEKAVASWTSEQWEAYNATLG